MADVAFGIEAAARAHGLRFTKLVTEDYFLACKRSKPARIALDAFIAAAQSSAFARALASVGGYDLYSAGTRVGIGDLLGAR